MAWMGRGTCAFPELWVDLFIKWVRCSFGLVDRRFYFRYPQKNKRFLTCSWDRLLYWSSLVLAWVSPVVAACSPRVCIKTCFSLSTISYIICVLSSVFFPGGKESCFRNLVTRGCTDGRKAFYHLSSYPNLAQRWEKSLSHLNISTSTWSRTFWGACLSDFHPSTKSQKSRAPNSKVSCWRWQVHWKSTG